MAISPPRSLRTTAASRGPAILGCVLFLFYAALIVAHGAPPLLGDFCDWIYSGVLLARHLHGLPDPAHALKHFPVPNSTLTLALGLLCAVMKWQLAARVYLLLHLALCLCACVRMARVSRSHWAWMVVPGAAFLSLGFWWGLFAFQLGVALLFFYLAGLLSHADDGDLPAGYGLLLVALFFTHMVPFTFACLMLCLFAWERRRWRLLWQMVLPAVLLAWYVVARTAAGNQDSTAAPTDASGMFTPTFVAYKINTVAKSFGLVNPTTVEPMHSAALAVLGRVAFLGAIAVDGLLCAAMVLLIGRCAVRGLRSGDRAAFFWRAAVICFVVYLLLPRSLLGISDPGARVLQIAAWPALFLCFGSDGLTRSLRWIAGASAVVLAVFSAVLFAVLPWSAEVPVSSAKVPHVAEVLAEVPYAHCAEELRALERGDYSIHVFPTALFFDRVADSR